MPTTPKVLMVAIGQSRKHALTDLFGKGGQSVHNGGIQVSILLEELRIETLIEPERS